jgi:hypothetical protein
MDIKLLVLNLFNRTRMKQIERILTNIHGDSFDSLNPCSVYYDRKTQFKITSSVHWHNHFF